MANTIAKNVAGYNYKYTDLAEIHSYLESVGCSYYQYIEPMAVGDEVIDYVMTVKVVDGKAEPAVRGCRVIQAQLKGNSNPAQEQGSGLTYARRYSLLLAFGLATTDDDGEAFSSRKEAEKITAKQADMIEAMLVNTGTDAEQFCAYFHIKKVGDLAKTDAQKAIKMLEAKKADKKRADDLPEAMKG